MVGSHESSARKFHARTHAYIRPLLLLFLIQSDDELSFSGETSASYMTAGGCRRSFLCTSAQHLDFDMHGLAMSPHSLSLSLSTCLSLRLNLVIFICGPELGGSSWGTGWMMGHGWIGFQISHLISVASKL